MPYFDPCGKCANCKKVERTRRRCAAVLARPLGSKGRTPGRDGDDVREVWNRALADWPCTGREG